MGCLSQNTGDKTHNVDFTPTVMSHFGLRPFTPNVATFPGSLPPCCVAELSESAGKEVEEVGGLPRVSFSFKETGT